MANDDGEIGAPIREAFARYLEEEARMYARQDRNSHGALLATVLRRYARRLRYSVGVAVALDAYLHEARDAQR